MDHGGTRIERHVTPRYIGGLIKSTTVECGNTVNRVVADNAMSSLLVVNLNWG